MDKLDLPPKRRTRTSRKAAGPTMVAVAEAAKVSIFTVSAVLNGTSVVSDELRKRVEAAIEITGYKPNSVARSLKPGRTQTIGVVIGDITNPFYTDVVAAVTSTSRQPPATTGAVMTIPAIAEIASASTAPKNTSESTVSCETTSAASAVISATASAGTPESGVAAEGNI